MSLRFNTGAMQYRESPSDNWQPLVIKANMNWESMAETYDPVSGSYEYGEYVLHNGEMFRCISTTGASGTWDSTKWTSVSVGDELASFIIISDTQPTETSNKIWIKESSAQDPVQIPTMTEFSALESDVVDISDDVDAIENTLTQLKTDTFGNINLTGTNNTGSTITAGTFFYNNGSLVRAKLDIQNGSAITIGTNAETVTAGGLNSLNGGTVYKVEITEETSSSGIFGVNIPFNKVVSANCATVGQDWFVSVRKATNGTLVCLVYSGDFAKVQGKNVTVAVWRIP